MIRVDITMVLFRPEIDELGRTIASLAEISSEFDVLHVLLSGSNADRESVERLFEAAGLAARTRLTHRFDNLGFSTGHNVLLADAFSEGAGAALVLNPDMRVAVGSVVELARIAAGSVDDALYGPSLARVSNDDESVGNAAETDSMGVGWSGDGRHFDIRQGEPFSIEPGRVQTVDGLTGACLFVPRGAYESIVEGSGWFFDDVFLAYREDAELGLRAKALGVESRLVHVEGFAHVRSVRGYARGRALPDLLGVRNRYVLKYRLGSLRPSSKGFAEVRDLLVAGATSTIERSSLPGLSSAKSIRRFVSNTSMVRRSGIRNFASRRAGERVRRLRVLYLGVESEQYPRNARVRAYLESHLDADITIVGIDKDPGAVRKARILMREGSAFPRDSFDVVVLAEFQLKYAPIARLLAVRYRALLVVDWFVGLYETRVEDWGMTTPGSLKGRAWRAVDSVAARIGDVVVTDSDERAKMLVRDYCARRRSTFTLPVGAPKWAQGSDRFASDEGRIRVLYYGGYLPLHGVDYVLEALAATERSDRLDVVFIGAGERRAAAERSARELGLSGLINFKNPIPEAQLADEIAAADLVLGVFGTSPKAASVIANKVWQGLSAGRVVVTRQSKALDEIRSIVGNLLIEVDPEDPKRLAQVFDDTVTRAFEASDAPTMPLESYVGERFAQFARAIGGHVRGH
ncbi:hypothetical protein C5B85_16745 [Pseudoclavibacter sp. AY1F1]|uniref:glycosyltransferase n=1 Tax=Pseudoclavibacter sp. AY1F1 TaxID=2080583 RepID=UPI000CE76BBC|nr:glycosyltransferase [Pseudoclavibacter sp. AY1F1]PPF42407.1 hypothetical protein C5B85_16745 [Pseudoclavibacter sp. AY1F1]